MQVILLTEGSDLDSLSSGYALTLLEKNTYIFMPHSYSNTVKLALNYFRKILEKKIIDKNSIKNVKKIYIVDTSSLEKINQILEESGLNYVKNITVIDHHEKIASLPDYIKKVPVPYGACTTYFVKKLKRKKIKLQADDATLIALGIYEDTGSFKYDNTTKEDIKALEFLIDHKLNFDIINSILTKRIDEKTIKILESIVENLQILQIKDKKIGISKIFSTDYLPDVSEYLNNITELNNLNGFFIFIIGKNKISVIARSKDIDVNEILSYFGGGGHKRAAAATVKDIDYEELEKQLEFFLIKTVLKEKTIKDFLIKNFKKVNINDEIYKFKEINDYFMFAVDDNDSFHGIVFLRTLKNTLKHGLKNLKIKDILIDDIFTFEENTPVYEAEKIALNASQDIFPVLKEKKPVGYITKISLVGSIHLDAFEEYQNVFISRNRIIPKSYNYAAKVEKYFPSSLINILKEIGKIAKKINMKVYLVGGIVRDIIMQRQNLDIDLIVEGDAIKLAENFAKTKKCKFHKFEEFMTSQIKINNLKIDLATARKEIYEYPGAYPKVEKATIREDLYRRDFTINTLAIDITEDNFGLLIDYFNGLQDIKNKKIRVLHELSFIDDPIRIFRALRFAGRFDFSLGKTTEKLLKVAIDQNLIKVAPYGRINLELNLTFNEEKVVEILNLMSKFKVLQQIIPYFEMTDERIIILEKIRENIIIFNNNFNKKINKSVVYMMGLTYHLPVEITSNIFEKLFFENTNKIFEEFIQVKDKINKKIKNSELYYILKELKPETVLFLMCYYPSDLYNKILEIMKKADKKIITGKDLINLGLKPTKEFSKIIDEITKLYLDGKINTKEEAIKFIKKKFL